MMQQIIHIETDKHNGLHGPRNYRSVVVTLIESR
jgi:hypothetical protein